MTFNILYNSHKVPTGDTSWRKRLPVLIDWILVTPEFKVKTIDILYYHEDGIYPSDHFPVVAKLLL